MNRTTLRLSILSFLFFFSLPFAFSQDYDSALGIRLGSANGISVKSFVSSQTAVEGMIVYRRHGIRMIGLTMVQIPLGRNSGTSLYVGGGAHYGFNQLFNPEAYAHQVAGVDGIVGIEFAFPHSQMSLSFDLKPMYELLGSRGFSGNNAGVTLRFYR